MRIGTEFEGLEYAGDLKIYVTPFLQPKCSQLIVKHIPPLAWHVPSQEYEKS